MAAEARLRPQGRPLSPTGPRELRFLRTIADEFDLPHPGPRNTSRIPEIRQAYKLAGVPPAEGSAGTSPIPPSNSALGSDVRIAGESLKLPPSAAAQATPLVTSSRHVGSHAFRGAQAEQYAAASAGEPESRSNEGSRERQSIFPLPTPSIPRIIDLPSRPKSRRIMNLRAIPGATQDPQRNPYGASTLNRGQATHAKQSSRPASNPAGSLRSSGADLAKSSSTGPTCTTRENAAASSDALYDLSYDWLAAKDDARVDGTATGNFGDTFVSHDAHDPFRCVANMGERAANRLVAGVSVPQVLAPDLALPPARGAGPAPAQVTAAGLSSSGQGFMPSPSGVSKQLVGKSPNAESRSLERTPSPPSRNFLSDNELARATRYREEGVPWRLIEQEMGYSRNVLFWKAQRGYFGREEQRKSRSSAGSPSGHDASIIHRCGMGDEEINMVKKYRAEGRAWGWIAKKTGWSKNALMLRRTDGLFGPEHRPTSRTVRSSEGNERSGDTAPAGGRSDIVSPTS